MAMNRATGAAILRDAEVDDLLVLPVTSASIAATVSTVTRIGSGTFRVPRVTADPTASWTAEGAEIAPSDAVLDEIEVTPPKVAGLVIISAELAADSSPEAAEVVGDGLARDIARQVDRAYFSAVAAPAPAGLLSVTGVGAVAVAGAWANLDFATEAVYKAADVGASLSAFVASPTDALALAKIKLAPTGSNQPLMIPSGDATQLPRAQLAGVPLFTSPYVVPGTIWGIPANRVHVVIREDAEVTSDASAFFTSHRVAVRAVMRVGFAFAHPAAIVKITRTP